MRHLLQRHPFPIWTHFAHSLVLTYALPPDVLAPLVPPGLTLDTYTDPAGTEHGFVAAAVVDARALRPAGLPERYGRDFLMTGYRVFTRFPTPTGRTMRGLRILRSDTDSRLMAAGGNVFTRYGYQHARLGLRRSGGTLEFKVLSHDGRADLHVRADIGDGVSPGGPRGHRGPGDPGDPGDLNSPDNVDGRAPEPAPLPAGSPFADARAARRFAGPLPYTFDHEPETDSMIVVRAVRTTWRPVPVTVEVPVMTYFRTGPFAGYEPVLANAFHVADVDYGWEAGSRRALDGSLR